MARQRPTAESRSKAAVAKTATRRTKKSNSGEKRETKGQTLRLNMDAWRQLRYLAFDNDVTAHELLIEAVNDLFQKYGKRPIA